MPVGSKQRLNGKKPLTLCQQSHCHESAFFLLAKHAAVWTFSMKHVRKKRLNRHHLILMCIFVWLWHTRKIGQSVTGACQSDHDKQEPLKKRRSELEHCIAKYCKPTRLDLARGPIPVKLNSHHGKIKNQE